MPAAIVLNPTHAKVGDTVVITGSGFTALDTITFKFAGSSITPTDAPIAADALGAFTAHIVIPASVEGNHTVEADDAHSLTGTATFATDPSFSIDPTSGPQGELVTLTGAGFAGSSAVTVQLDGVTVSAVSPITTDSTGGLSGALQLASSIASGAHTITVTDASANTLNATFTVNKGILVSVEEKNSERPFTITTGVIDEEGIPVANNNYVTAAIIDMRNYVRATIEMFCSDSTNDLTYSILGLVGNEDGTMPAASDARWVSAGTGFKDQNVTHQTGAVAEITTRYSWLRLDVKRKTSGQDSKLDVYGRLHRF